MTGLRLFAHQFRYDQKLFWRNPATVFFSVAMPLIFLFLLGAAFGGGNDRDPVYKLLSDQYLVPAIMTLGIVSATFVNMAMTITFQREMGVLKRMRGTPLPTTVFVAARTASAVVNATMIAVVILLAGKLVYGVDINSTRLIGVAITTIVGAVCFCSLGFALSVFIPNQAAAPAITNMIVLPLYFISGVFGDASKLPDVLREVGRIFPVYHLGACLFQSFSPTASGIGMHWGDLLNVAAWGAAGLIFASLKFRWEPREAT
jgi:ABC-2 type transport system permease protein